MAGIWKSDMPVGSGNAHMAARLRGATTPALPRAIACDYGKSAVVEQGTWFATVGIHGRLKGLEGAGTG